MVEKMSRLLAYQAASQLISTADSMFQTILGAVRR